MVVVVLPLMGGIKVNPVGPLGRRLTARHDDLSWQRSVQRRLIRAEWASYRSTEESPISH